MFGSPVHELEPLKSFNAVGTEGAGLPIGSSPSSIGSKEKTHKTSCPEIRKTSLFQDRTRLIRFLLNCRIL